MANEIEWMQNLTYTARQDRAVIEALGTEGLLYPLSYKTTQRAAGANMTVDVAAGLALVTGDNVAAQGKYLARATAVNSVTITAAPGAGLTRIDLIVIQVNDPADGGGAGNNFTLAAVPGTPAGSPTEPALPASALRIAKVTVPTGKVSILDADITDQRVLSSAMRIGEVQIWAGPSSKIPNGWLICDGLAVSRTTYAELFDLIGTTFGVGNGSTTYNVPDLRGRLPVGLDNMGGTDAARLAGANTLGLGGGAETHVLATANLPAHTHTIDHDHAPGVNPQTSSEGAHTHSNTLSGAVSESQNAGSVWAASSTTSSSSGAHTHTVDIPIFTGASGSTGSGSAINHMPPYQLMNYLIMAA